MRNKKLIDSLEAMEEKLRKIKVELHIIALNYDYEDNKRKEFLKLSDKVRGCHTSLKEYRHCSIGFTEEEMEELPNEKE